MATAALALIASAAPVAAQVFTVAPVPALAGLVTFATGAAWVDADGDGDLDLFVTTGFSTPNDNAYFRNDGGGTFVAVSGIPLVMDGADSPCSTWADFDNDGDLDAFVSNYFAPGGMLYVNHGGGALALDTTRGAGGDSQRGTGCAWGDYDGDGQVDLVIAGLGTVNHLLHNQGDGTFAPVLTGPEVTTVDTHHHPTWADFDGDGDLDLFFATGPVGSTDTDRMYRNLLVETGTATFEAITTAPIATDARDSQVLSWIDYDNDGDLDLYAVNYTSVPNQLYRNDGGGAFTRILTGAMVTDLGAAHGVAWGDYDNDGDLDVYVARDLRQNNRYYRNDGGDTFTSVTLGPFVNEGLSNYAAVAADEDQDGDLDLFVPTARSEDPSLLFRNDLANGNHWLILRCEGVVSNRSAIGARVRVRATIGGVPRWQRRDIQAGTGYGGQNALEAHFGLGDAAVADSVRIEWPSGVIDVLTGVAANRLVPVREGLVAAAPSPRVEGGGPKLDCAPNPLRDRAIVEVRLDRPSTVALAVFDAGGREVLELCRGSFAAGVHAVPFDGRSLPHSGVYWIRLRAGAIERVRRVVRL